MNKPKKYSGYGHQFVNQLRSEAKYTFVPFGVYGVKDTEFQLKVREKFSTPAFIVSEADEVEEVIDTLNDMCETNGNDFAMPLPNYTDDVIVQFDNGIILHMLCADEYHGHGESETYISLHGVVVPEETSEEEIFEAVDWLKEVFNIA